MALLIHGWLFFSDSWSWNFGAVVVNLIRILGEWCFYLIFFCVVIPKF